MQFVRWTRSAKCCMQPAMCENVQLCQKQRARERDRRRESESELRSEDPWIMQKASKDDLEVGRSTLSWWRHSRWQGVKFPIVWSIKWPMSVSWLWYGRAVGRSPTRSLTHSACRWFVLEQKIYDKINNLTGKQRKPKKAAIDKAARTRRQKQQQRQQQLSWARLNFMTVARPSPTYCCPSIHLQPPALAHKRQIAYKTKVVHKM